MLASLSLLLNGSALDQIRTVTEEWGKALLGREAVGVGVDVLDPALTVVREQQESLTSMLDAVDRFAADGRHVLDSSSAAISTDLKALRPVLDELAGAGPHLAGSLYLALSAPFPVSTFENMARGDYLNLFMTLDLSSETLANDVLGSFPDMQLSAPSSLEAPVNPLTAPLGSLGAPQPPPEADSATESPEDTP